VRRSVELYPPLVCPQCAKPHFKGPRWTKNDPVTFENTAGAPVDLFYWNGTCEEMVSWDEVGGVQPLSQKRLQSTHGHTFRVRSAASQRLVMQHTLSDIVIRPCNSDETRRSAPTASARAIALSRAAAQVHKENQKLRADLQSQLADLLQAMRSASANASVGWAQPDAAGLFGDALLARSAVDVGKAFLQ